MYNSKPVIFPFKKKGYTELSALTGHVTQYRDTAPAYGRVQLQIGQLKLSSQLISLKGGLRMLGPCRTR